MNIHAELQKLRMMVPRCRCPRPEKEITTVRRTLAELFDVPVVGPPPCPVCGYGQVVVEVVVRDRAEVNAAHALLRANP